MFYRLLSTIVPAVLSFNLPLRCQTQALDSAQAAALIEKGDLYYQSYEMEKAIASYDMLIANQNPQLSPQRIQAGFKKANAYYHLQNNSQEINSFADIYTAQNSYNLNNPEAAALFWLARARYYYLYQQRDSMNEVVKLAEQAINSLPDAANTAEAKAYYYFNKLSLYSLGDEGNLQKAAFTQALAYAAQIKKEISPLKFAIYQSHYENNLYAGEAEELSKNMAKVKKIADNPQYAFCKKLKAEFLAVNVMTAGFMTDSLNFVRADKAALEFMTANNFLNKPIYGDYLSWRALVYKDRYTSYGYVRGFYKEVIDIAGKNPLAFQFNTLLDVYINYAYVHIDNTRENNSLDTGLIYMEKAWQMLLPEPYKGGNWGEFPDMSNPRVLKNAVNAYDAVLRGLVYAYNVNYQQKKEEKYKKALFNTLNAAETLLNAALKSTSNESQRQRFAANVSELLSRKVDIYKRLYKENPKPVYLNEFWQLSQQCNARSSRYSQSEDKALAIAQVDNKLVTAYQTAKKELENATLRLSISQKNGDKTQANYWAKELGDKNEKTVSLNKTIGEKYPLYKQMVGELSWVKIEQIRPLLKNSALILHYSGRLENYQLLLTQDTFIYYDNFLPFGGKGKEVIDSINTFLHTPPDNSQSEQIYKANFERLLLGARNAFFQQWAYLEKNNIQNVIIVPDQLTAALPFEVLLLSDNNTDKSYKDWAWAVKTFNFQYLPSLSFWLQSRQQSQQNDKSGKMLAFAPTYQNGVKNALRSKELNQIRANLSELSGAKRELENLKTYYYGDYHIGQEANEALFKSKTKSSYAIIHFAMHGLLDENLPELSSLAFSESADTIEDNFLTAYEIAQLPQRSQLVVLSACETAKGKTQLGEGVMSLAQYFLYGGAPAVVATRWQVNDQTTAFIMQNFYKYLYEGQTIKAALRTAQLDYLAQAKGQSAHPFYWSPFTNVGDTDKSVYLASADWANKYYLIGTSAILVIIGLLWIKFRKKE